MSLMKRLLIDAQAKFRRMVEENRSVGVRIDGEIRQAQEEMAALREELADTSRRLEETLTVQSDSSNSNSNTNSNSNCEVTSTSTTTTTPQTLTSVTSTSTGDNPPQNNPSNINDSGHQNNSNSNEASAESNPTNEVNVTNKTDSNVNNPVDDHNPSANSDNLSTSQVVRPSSPIAGPSSKPDFAMSDVSSSAGLSGPSSCTINTTASSSSSSNITTRLRLENERLKREVSELKKLVSASGAHSSSFSTSSSIPETSSHLELEGLSDSEKIQALESELAHAREALSALKADRKRLKAEKFDLLNQMKQLYGTLEDKEKELRDFIRSFEQRMRDSEECLSQERSERERERWSLLRHARDEAERSLSLAAQLDLKEQQLLEARRQLSTAGCLSDQESLASVSICRGVNGSSVGAITPTAGTGGGLAPSAGDRGSCSADSGVRGSSDRESGATSTGGNLSDSTTDVTTPKECNSPSLSPLNAHSFSRSLDNSTLSRSVEQLSSPPMEVEPIRRTKDRMCRGAGSRSSTGGPWGSISRVFARSRHRKVPSPSSQDDGACEVYGRSWSPLTEEGYAEKLRLLREATSIPMERWRAPTVLAWLEIALGMPQYGPRCAENVKSGKVLLELSDLELECGLGITHPMHRKKLRLAIEEHRHPSLVRYPCIAQLGHTWVSSEWLPDLGLAQYSENFATNMVDARMLDHLSKKELEKFLGVNRKFHQASIVHGIHLLRMMKYDRQALAVRRHQCETIDADPLVWTNQRFIRWARNIDLGEYADNLKDSGVHGALVVLEPSLSGDTMATALGIPPSRHMIRRHLTTELEALVLPARAAFEHFVRVSAAEKRRAEQLLGGGSLGRSFSRSYAAGLADVRASAPPFITSANTSNMSSPIHDIVHPVEKDKRRASLRGSLSRALGLKSSKNDTTPSCHSDFISSRNITQMASPSSSSENSSTFNCRPDSPQSAIAVTHRRRPHHRHRRR
ncbi:liprin protein kazrin [Lycorma delicatula]|uniref:liprin protein kazrin n=1 Tax=Lycorma delicatula TaxID=130591 RepID=UPI003F50EDC3